jgi:hypothetical protein
MQIRVVRQPSPHELEPFDLSRLEVGRVYDIGPTMAALLIACGYAEPEMRSRQETGHPARRREDTQAS